MPEDVVVLVGNTLEGNGSRSRDLSKETVGHRIGRGIGEIPCGPDAVHGPAVPTAVQAAERDVIVGVGVRVVVALGHVPAHRVKVLDVGASVSHGAKGHGHVQGHGTANVHIMSRVLGHVVAAAVLADVQPELILVPVDADAVLHLHVGRAVDGETGDGLIAAGVRVMRVHAVKSRHVATQHDVGGRADQELVPSPAPGITVLDQNVGTAG